MEANYHDYLIELVKSEKAINYRMRAASVLGGKVIVPMIKGKKYRQVLTTFTDELR